MSKGSTRYNTRFFAEQVIPKLRDVHAGWTDHWWPQAMEPAQRANVPVYRPNLFAKSSLTLTINDTRSAN
jgi:hypothetical protein